MLMTFHGCLSFFELKIWFILRKFEVFNWALFSNQIHFDGVLCLFIKFLCWKSDLFWPNLWFVNITSTQFLINFDDVLRFYCRRLSSQFDIFWHSVGPKTDSYWWRFEGYLNMFVLKTWLILTKLMIFNYLMAKNLIHFDCFLWLFKYFSAQNYIYFDQFYNFPT